MHRPSALPTRCQAAASLALALLPASAALLASPAVAGTASVAFENPQAYADTGPRRDAEQVQKTLAAHLERLAAERLPAGQTLQLTVTDIDLAGEIPPAMRALHAVRVMGQWPDWPRISLRYTWRDGSRLLAEGSEVVTDMTYLQRAGRLLDHQHALPHERRMLSEWFDQRFVKPARQ